MKAVIIGASGGIGRALTSQLAERRDVEQVIALSRSPVSWPSDKVKSGKIDITDEASISTAAREAGGDGPVDLVIVAAGFLSGGPDVQPEKTYKKQTLAAFEHVFAINTFGPALIARYFLPLLSRQSRSVFAVLSARVGSISDNRMGGWHAYRASKAALNMLIKNYAIEMGRTHPDFIAVGLHPGTVDTGLSKPFQGNVPDGKLFSPDQSAGYLLSVIDQLKPADSGKVFDWAGKEVPA